MVPRREQRHCRHRRRPCQQPLPVSKTLASELARIVQGFSLTAAASEAELRRASSCVGDADAVDVDVVDDDAAANLLAGSQQRLPQHSQQLMQL